MKKIFLLSICFVHSVYTINPVLVSSLIKNLSSPKYKELSVKALASAQFFLKKTDDGSQENEQNKIDQVEVKSNPEEDIEKFRKSVKKFLQEQARNASEPSTAIVVPCVNQKKRLSINDLTRSNDRSDDSISPLTVKELFDQLNNCDDYNLKCAIINNHKKLFRNLLYLELFHEGIWFYADLHYKYVDILGKEDEQHIIPFFKVELSDPDSYTRAENLFVFNSSVASGSISLEAAFSLCKNLKYGYRIVDIIEGISTQSELVELLKIAMQDKKAHDYKEQITALLEELIMKDDHQIREEAGYVSFHGIHRDLSYIICYLLQHDICTKHTLISLLQKSIAKQDSGMDFTSSKIIGVLFFEKLLTIEEIQPLFENYSDSVKPEVRERWQKYYNLVIQ